MILTRRILIQMAIFIAVAATALAIMVFGYMRLPEMVGIGQYRVTVELPETGGLYPRANVTYRGAQVGLVDSVELTDSGAGVAAVLKLTSNIKIPADVEAKCTASSAVGEQYVQLIPRSGRARISKTATSSLWTAPRCPRISTPSSTTRPWARGDPQGQPQDGHRRGLYRSRWPRARASPAGQRQHRVGHRRSQEPRPPDHTYRPVQAGAGFADRYRGLDPGVGGEPGEHHRTAAEPGPRGGRHPAERPWCRR